MASTDAKLAPVKAAAFRMPIGPFFKTDGTIITSWTSPDSEISKDGGNYADCTNEATEIQTSGTGYLDLDTSETNCDGFWVKTTISNTDAVPFVAYFATQRAGAYLGADVKENAGTAITSASGIQEVKVASIAANAITAAAIATDAIDADALKTDAITEIQSGLSTLDAGGVRTAVGLASANLDTQLDALPTATENADALLKRDWTSVTGEAARSVLNALRFLRNKWSLSGSTLTVTQEDDTTSAWTAAVSTDASADPITGSDPA